MFNLLCGLMLGAVLAPLIISDKQNIGKSKYFIMLEIFIMVLFTFLIFRIINFSEIFMLLSLGISGIIIVKNGYDLIHHEINIYVMQSSIWNGFYILGGILALGSFRILLENENELFFYFGIGLGILSWILFEVKRSNPKNRRQFFGILSAFCGMLMIYLFLKRAF